MILPLDDDWRIASDPHTWMVQRRKVFKVGKRAGDVEWESVEWYPTLEMAVVGSCERRCREISTETWVDSLAEFRRLHGDVTRLAREFRIQIQEDESCR